MLEQALAALAAAGGTAVVQAAGTEAWTTVRDAVARWFGRGDERRERAELERLDRTAAELEPGGPEPGGGRDQGPEPGAAGSAQARVRQEAAWQARFENLLESVDGDERARLAGELRALLERHSPAGVPPAGPSVGRDGMAVGGDVHVRADGGVAGGVIHGGAHVHPRPPGPPQG
ncbi:hypothetical protein ACLIYM_07375 [Streptomyces fenghuangensis]|uniref:hypothetical protein n=1 Tax=Streptomyces sp. ICN903 TaxID=2964654 RepID=UPI001EDC4B2B|nr:hypothetical protein [Streptomyces sp. ICN903]MCG3044024.1 hypothetical protein [Streptomyces sp. ICN903]